MVSAGTQRPASMTRRASGISGRCSGGTSFAARCRVISSRPPLLNASQCSAVSKARTTVHCVIGGTGLAPKSRGGSTSSQPPSKIAARVWWRMWAPNYTRRDTASKTPRDEAWVRPRVRGRRACARGALHRKGRQRNGRGRLRRDRQGREPAPGAYLLHRGELVLGEGGDHGTASEHGVRRCEVAHRTGAHPG